MPKTRKIFGGNLLNLYLEKRRLPNGFTVNLEIIKHPGAVLVVPFLSVDEVVLIRQYRPLINSYIWELPAGTFHLNEAPLKCARRELAEETGYRAGSFKKIGHIYPAPGYTTEKIIIYEARRLNKIASKNEEDEIIIIKPLKRGAIKKLFNSGKIIDAKTICALKFSHVI